MRAAKHVHGLAGERSQSAQPGSVVCSVQAHTFRSASSSAVVHGTRRPLEGGEAERRLCFMLSCRWKRTDSRASTRVRQIAPCTT